MSKLYKSEQCVEADPCRLQPADVEAFFINNGFTGETGKDSVLDADHSRDTGEEEKSSKNKDVSQTSDVSRNTTAEEDASWEATTSQEASVSVNADETMEVDASSPENGAPQTELEKLFDVAGHIRSLLEAGHQAANLDSEKTDFKSEPGFSAKSDGITALVSETTSPAPEVKKGVPKAFNPPRYQSGKGASTGVEAGVEPVSEPSGEALVKSVAEVLAKASGAEVDFKKEAEAARERAKQIFAGAQREAGEMTEKARSQAESLLSQAQLQMNQQLEGAEQEAGSILSGARSEAGQITSGASLRAQSMLKDAEGQAESIVESAKQKVLQLIENAKKEAEKITGVAQQEASELKAAGKKEADDMLAAAVEESVNLKNQARQEGLETGRSEGAAHIRQELEQNLAIALSLIDQAEEERLKRIGSSEPELLKLAVGIAEKIIGAELKLDPTTQLEITREALTRGATANNIIIRVNSEDIKQFTEHSVLLQRAFTEPKMIRIEEDPGVTPGNCYIETEHGNIDPRIKSQLEVIWAELLKAGSIS